jgi:hypothetical protein
MDGLSILSLILIVSCSVTGLCLLTGAAVRWHIYGGEPDIIVDPVPAVMLVQAEPDINTSTNAIPIIAYRNNTIHTPIEIDNTYIQMEEYKVGEKEFNMVAYAVMV